MDTYTWDYPLSAERKLGIRPRARQIALYVMNIGHALTILPSFVRLSRELSKNVYIIKV